MRTCAVEEPYDSVVSGARKNAVVMRPFHLKIEPVEKKRHFGSLVWSVRVKFENLFSIEFFCVENRYSSNDIRFNDNSNYKTQNLFCMCGKLSCTQSNFFKLNFIVKKQSDKKDEKKKDSGKNMRCVRFSKVLQKAICSFHRL